MIGARYTPRPPKWSWRDFLTENERVTLAAADAAKAEWRRLNVERAAITNRAIQRAKYHMQGATVMNTVRRALPTCDRCNDTGKVPVRREVAFLDEIILVESGESPCPYCTEA